MRNSFHDVVVASSLVSAPAWVPSLAQFNSWLTTFSLMVGLCLGLLRLYTIITTGVIQDEKEDDMP